MGRDVLDALGHRVPRRHYTLTDDGATALEAFTAAWKPFTTAVTAISEPER